MRASLAIRHGVSPPRFDCDETGPETLPPDGEHLPTRFHVPDPERFIAGDGCQSPAVGEKCKSPPRARSARGEHAGAAPFVDQGSQSRRRELREPGSLSPRPRRAATGHSRAVVEVPLPAARLARSRRRTRPRARPRGRPGSSKSTTPRPDLGRVSRSAVPLFQSQILTVPSPDPDASNLPSGLSDNAWTKSPCCMRRLSRAVLTSRIRITPSARTNAIFPPLSSTSSALTADSR